MLFREGLMLATSNLEGPWQVVLWGAPDDSFWYIFNTKTERFRKVGRKGARRANYREAAYDTAKRLNDLLKTGG